MPGEEETPAERQERLADELAAAEALREAERREAACAAPRSDTSAAAARDREHRTERR